MGRIPPWQSAVLDVLDLLFFNQILVFSVFDDSECEWLRKIVEDVGLAVQETGATRIEAECIKHGVLCLLEIMLSDDQEKQEAAMDLPLARAESLKIEDVRKIDAYTREYFQALLSVLWEKAHGDVMKAVMQIATNLADRFSAAPSTVRYRLSERCLAIEFQMAPLDFLSWAAKAGIISSAKYSPAKLAETPSEMLAARVGLLCEFAMVRNYMCAQTYAPNIAGVALDNSVTSLSQDTVITLLKQKYRFEERCRLLPLRNTVPVFKVGRGDDSDCTRMFFNTVGQVYTRYRIWNGTLASWPGALGAAMVEIKRRSKRRPGKPLYNDLNNSGSITDDVAKLLNERGFTINGRTLYQRHHEFSEKVFRQIRTYHYLLRKFGVAFSPHQDDMMFYSLISSTADQK